MIDLDACIGVLSREDTHYLQKNWEESSRWIFEHAAAGADTSAALPALVSVYMEATQIGVLRAAAAAIAVHDLRTGDVSRLRELLKKGRYRDWVLEGIGDALGKGLSLSPALGLILENSGAREYLVIQLLLRHAGKRGLVKAAGEVARRAPATLAEFLKEAQSRKFKIERALPDLAAQLGDARLAANSATAFRWIVELGADLSGVVTSLEAHLDAKNEDVAAEAGYCLAYHHAANRAWPAVDTLLSAKQPRAAWAAARALRVRLVGGGDDVPELVDRVAAGLLAADPDTAARSLVALREAKEKGRRCTPSHAIVSKLAASLDDRIAEFLHMALPAAEIRKLGAAKGPSAERLKAASEACGICARLPRLENWSHESELPKEHAMLTASGAASRCPECGRYYRRHYEDEWDDMSHSELWTLARWTPPEVLAGLEGAALQEFAEALDGWIERLRREVRHPALAVREEAAYDLAAHFTARSQWAEVRGLIATSEAAVQVRILKSIRKRPEDLSPFVDFLRGLLDSPHSAVRSSSAEILSTQAVRLNDVAALRVFLSSTDYHFLAAAAGAVFQGTLKGFDAVPLFDLLAPLRHRPEGSISDPVRYTLTALASKPREPDALPLFVEDLAFPVANVRTSAASALQQLAPSRPDAAAAVPRLVALLRDPECVSWGRSGLQALAEAGADIRSAVPVIVACALDPECHRREDMLYWLQRLAARGADLRHHVPSIASLLSGREALQSAAHQLLQELFQRNVDLAAAVPPLRAMLDDAPPYLREHAARLLSHWHLKTRDTEGLRTLLRHSRAEPSGTCADVLRETAFDLTPLLPDLVRLTGHPKSWPRNCAAAALVAFAKSGTAAREAVLSALEGAGEHGAAIRERIMKA